MERKLLKEIEKLNLEIIELKNSSEYHIGLKLKRMINLLIRGKIFTFFNESFKSIFNVFLKTSTPNSSIIQNEYEIPVIETNLKKTVIYTCIVGNYDKIPKIYLKEKDCDYILFTDNENFLNQKSEWNIVLISNDLLEKYSDIEINRYYKMNSIHLFAKDYKYSIYIDGSISIISTLTDLVTKINKKYGLAMHVHRYRDCLYEEAKVCTRLKKGNIKNLKKQVNDYKKKGVPKNYGLLECGMIYTDLTSKQALRTMDLWWNEFITTKSNRDQIALSYILWKLNILPKDIGTLGLNIYKNPKIRVDTHLV